MATGYVTNWGNDANDGFSWNTPKKTFQGALDAGFNPIYAKGWYDYFFNITSNYFDFHGENLIIFGNNASYSSYLSILENTYFYNLSQLFGNGAAKLYKCVLKDILKFNLRAYGTYGATSKYSIFNNVIDLYIKNYNNYTDSYSNTIINSKVYIEEIIKNNIYYNCNINIKKSSENIYSYNLFISSKFMFTGGGLGTDETDYTYPSGADDDAKLQNLRDRMAVVYGGNADDYLIGCKYYSRNAPDGQEEDEPYASAYQDIFVDADNDNFYLKEGCIAANMSYEGSYIGAKPVGAQVNLTDFTLSNIDSAGKITDQEVDATAESNIIDLGKIRKILSWNSLGERAARNGQQINSISNLSTAISAGSNVLTAGKTYMVINNVITLDDAAGTSYNPWDTFVAVDEGSGAGLGFSTTDTGQVQEVLIDQYDQKIQVQCSKTDSSLGSATTLTFFQNEQPMVNVDSNGVPTLGNADTGYDEAKAVELYTRYMRFFITVKANNLPAR